MNRTLLAATTLLMLGGGLWISLFSCGSHDLRVPILLCGLILCLVTVGGSPRTRVTRAVALFLILLLGHHLVMAVGAPFYPASPKDFRAWAAGFVDAALHGPC